MGTGYRYTIKTLWGLAKSKELGLTEEEISRPLIGVVNAQNEIIPGHIHLNTLARVGHLLIGLWFVVGFWLRLWKHAQPAHDAEESFGAAGIAALTQAVPQFHHAQFGITAAHIPDQFQFCLGVLVGVAVRPPGLAGQRFQSSIPTGFPEVDV